ncbi:MAG: hypothetical protein ABF489_03435 [Bifidobacterium sp.]|uniref:hypothetical protein n=1 Tax=Bifidobacterium sp. TaxID=41200 RepID=UPI0039EB77EB
MDSSEIIRACKFLALGKVQTGENGMTAVGFKPIWGVYTLPSSQNLQSGSGRSSTARQKREEQDRKALQRAEAAEKRARKGEAPEEISEKTGEIVFLWPCFRIDL